MRVLSVNDVIKAFNRYYIDAVLTEERNILGIGDNRRFKREQFEELYKPLFMALWIRVLDTDHKEASDTVRDAYLKGLKECFRRQKGEYERVLDLVVEYESMLGDFSEVSFGSVAREIVKKVSRNKDALDERSQKMARIMQGHMENFAKMLADVTIEMGKK